MAGHLSNSINIGVADVFFTPAGASIPIYLGLTKDGASVKYEESLHEITSDQTGSTPLDDIVTGQKITAEVKVLDTSKEKISALMPSATLTGDAVTFGQRPGLRVTHYAGKLRIHPVSMGDDQSNDVIIYRTANTGSLDLAFKLEEEWVMPCVFKGYYDDLRKPGDQLFRIGADSEDDGTYKRVIQFWITPPNPKVNIGGTVSFRANAMFEDGSTEDVTADCTWLTSDSEIVSLTDGVPVTATAIAAGSAIVRAEYIGYSNSTAVVVE